MRVSRLMLITLRDVPAEADIISHQLLIRGGFIRRLTGGIYAYMPLLWKVLKKITLIVEEEFGDILYWSVLLQQLLLFSLKPSKAMACKHKYLQLVA